MTLYMILIAAVTGASLARTTWLALKKPALFYKVLPFVLAGWAMISTASFLVGRWLGQINTVVQSTASNAVEAILMALLYLPWVNIVYCLLLLFLARRQTVDAH